MLRKLFFDGKSIVEHDVLIGNHGHAQLTVRGNFFIGGLVYCPKFSLEIVVRGNGILMLRGICRRLIIKRVTGNAVLKFEQLRMTELLCNDLSGTSELRVVQPKYVLERNVGINAKLHIINQRSDDAVNWRSQTVTLPPH
jgi:hypothetical protein